MNEEVLSGQALVVRGPGDVGLEERAHPSPSTGHVLVKPHFVGVCGTDLEIIRGDLDPAYVRYPLVLGHEWSGRVAAVGEGVDTVHIGDPVVVEGILACGKCRACRAGKTNLCENYDELGFTTDGAAGPAVTVSEAFTHRLSDDVSLEAAALVEPAAVVLRGLREIALAPGQRVLIIGDGTVALLAAQLIRMWSPSVVMMSGRRAEQRDLAAAVGVDQFTVDPLPDRAYDVVIEAAGATAAVETALGAADMGGSVLLLGIAGHGNAAKMYVDDVVNKDLSVSAAASATPRPRGPRRYGSSTPPPFDPYPLITHRYPLEKLRRGRSTRSPPP